MLFGRRKPGYTTTVDGSVDPEQAVLELQKAELAAKKKPKAEVFDIDEQTWKAMQENPAYADIEELTNNQNERFLFSTKHLTRRYAKAISDVDDFCD